MSAMTSCDWKVIFHPSKTRSRNQKTSDTPNLVYCLYILNIFHADVRLEIIMKIIILIDATEYE